MVGFLYVPFLQSGTYLHIAHLYVCIYVCMCVLTTLLLADTMCYPASKVSDWLHEITVVCTVLPLVATYSFVASMQSKGTVQIYSSKNESTRLSVYNPGRQDLPQLKILYCMSLTAV